MMEEVRLRRSARLSALNACKEKEKERTNEMGPERLQRGVCKAKIGEKWAKDELAAGNVHGSIAKKRGRKKKRLIEVEEVAIHSVKKSGREAKQTSEHDDFTSYNIDKSSCGESWLPEKQVLEQVLDLLQKRDTCEIFTKPFWIHPVEGYYGVIQNPMDFSKMRAKLQEGLYKNLEQFEEDVLLICNNVMHFTSSATLFFKQACSIYELAKKIFHAWRTNPQNFEAEFSPVRPKPQQASTKHINGRNEGVASRTGIGIYPSQRQHSSNHQPGSRDGQEFDFPIEEWCDSYKPNSSGGGDEQLSKVLNSTRQLEAINPSSFCYADSLMQFVKELGPTAQKIAHCKLQQCQVMERNLHCSTMADLEGFIPHTGLTKFLASQTPNETITGHSAPLMNDINRNHAYSSTDRNNTYESCKQSSNIPSSSYQLGNHERNSNDTHKAAREINHWNQSLDVPSCSYLPAAQIGNSDDTCSNVGEIAYWKQRITNSGNKYKAKLDGLGATIAQNQLSKPVVDVPQSKLFESASRYKNDLALPPLWPLQASETLAPSQANDPINNSNLFSLTAENSTVVAQGQSQPSQNGHSLVLMGRSGNPESCSRSQTVLSMSFLESRLKEIYSMGKNEFSIPQQAPPTSCQEPTFFKIMGGGKGGLNQSNLADSRSQILCNGQLPSLDLQLKFCKG